MDDERHPNRRTGRPGPPSTPPSAGGPPPRRLPPGWQAVPPSARTEPRRPGPPPRGGGPAPRGGPAGRPGTDARGGGRPPATGREPRLLTHDDTGRSRAASPSNASAATVTMTPTRTGGSRPDTATRSAARSDVVTGTAVNRASAPTRRPPGGAGGGSGRPPTGGKGRKGDGRSGPAPKKGWRRARRIAYVLIGLFVVAPVVAFAIGWIFFRVPTADDATNNQVATIAYSDGKPLASLVQEQGNRIKVPIGQVPLHVQQAVLSAEDRSFYTNYGFDPVGIIRAAWNQAQGGVGGGSTITQQYVKNVLVGDEYSLWRKYREVVIAAKISQEQSKEEILGNYLNTIYFGRGSYGIQAASQAYFGKDVSALTPSDGAMLAGLIQAPSKWDPAVNRPMSEQRWNFVLDGMVGQRWLAPADRAAATFPVTVPPSPRRSGIPENDRGHIVSAVRDELATLNITEQQVNQEGLQITTTIDPERQQEAVDAAEKVLKGQPQNLRSAVVSQDPKTGAVLAYYGGEEGSGFDYAQTRRQPGSSFKPFVTLAGLQRSDPIGLGTTFNGSTPMTIAGTKVQNSEGESCPNCDLKTATTLSINTVFYQLGNEVGPQKVADAARQAGVTADLPNPTGGIALGDKEVRPGDMASAYATFASGGMYQKPHMVARVTASDGRVLFDAGAPAGERRMSEQVARNVVESMLDVADHAKIGLAGGRPAAAKTGTVQSSVEGQNNDAWTVGFTPQISTAVWVGTDDNSPIKTSNGRPIYGRGLPGQIWQGYMNSALKGSATQQFGEFDPIGAPPAPPTPTPTPGAPTPAPEGQYSVNGVCVPYDQGGDQGDQGQNNGDQGQNNGDQGQNNGDQGQNNGGGGGGQNEGGGGQNDGGGGGQNDGGGGQGQDDGGGGLFG